jgi:hypothetical protein
MTTVNISITDQQNEFINQITSEFGFDNRSEFFRNLIRLIQFKPDLVSQVSTFPFQSPPTRSRSKVLKAFTATGKYSKEFLKDLKKGLEDSKDFFYHK